MEKKQLFNLGMAVFLVTILITLSGMSAPQTTYELDYGITEESIGLTFIENTLMASNRGSLRDKDAEHYTDENLDGSQVETEDVEQGEVKELAQTENPVEYNSSETENVEQAPVVSEPTGPVIILYHTHATESYNPYTEGNYHIVEEPGTVREVGNVMAEELTKLGYRVVHDKTLHDHPSYNESYNRAYNTVISLLQQHEDVAAVIDIHRDAAAYTGNIGKTAILEGETVATYKVVVGLGNPNAQALQNFASEFNSKAESLYPGFYAGTIEKNYKYNQYVSDNYLLLEVGNNENNIKDAMAAGKFLARVLDETIKN